MHQREMKRKKVEEREQINQQERVEKEVEEMNIRLKEKEIR